MSDVIETYLHDIALTRGTGVAETSGYPALAALLNALGTKLKPKVHCIINPANAGAGIPDGGFFTPNQFPRQGEEPIPGLVPERGALEVKPVEEDLRALAQSEQVARYREKYRQVLLTNYRQFLLVGYDSAGQARTLEEYSLADTEAEFWQLCAHPRKAAGDHGERLAEYLRRALRRQAPVADPQAVAWFLASYARDARSRLEQAPDLQALTFVRTALEEALGLEFEGDKGDHFFRSTLVQTLFYGIFAAWVLWHKADPRRQDRFNWHEASWSLHVPMISALYEQIASPGRLGALHLTEVLEWTGEVLGRVDRPSFFAAFDEGQAVQYFYEPFLQAFDPELRKQLGVWYTPGEIVHYMVERVDRVLREELQIADGLADPRVYVLDPCCGTGAYLVAVLDRIERTLRDQGGDGLVAQQVKRAAVQRVFGFEIMPAPFVVSHLQLGLHLRNLGAPLTANTERAAVYLTNALTGWEPPEGPKQQLALVELQEERDAADEVKQRRRILVVLGNPPYNGFAGVAVAEERTLSNAYRTTRQAPPPQGQGLNDLYVRFFRMAERRIVEMSGQGVVCFISNYSWLDGLSFTGMRERYLEVFDSIWVDCLNGDKYSTGKTTPDGHPDPSVFSTEASPEGIQVGTAIGLLVRQQGAQQLGAVHFRHLWGATKRDALAAEAASGGTPAYETLSPPLALGLPFMPAAVAGTYLSWPLLPELLPTFSSGVNTSRDMDVVDMDEEPLRQRMAAYFDPDVDEQELRRIVPSMMTSTARFDAAATRRQLLAKGLALGSFVRYAYRPFDTRWVYWHPETKLLDEKREELFSLVGSPNRFLTSRQKAERRFEGTPFYVTPRLPDRHLTRPGCACFPVSAPDRARLDDGLFAHPEDGAAPLMPNLSAAARQYLTCTGIAAEELADTLWLHALAIGYSPAYLTENADGMRQDWPRIPLPASREALLASAELGQQVAALLDTERPVPGVTTGTIRHELRSLAVIGHAEGRPLDPAAGDLAITAGWGHAGNGGVTMPGKGDRREREYCAGECVAGLGEMTGDVYLSDHVYWCNVPERVWEYTIGGYQVMKKWLSYRERKLLGRDLTVDEARYVTEMARRLAAIILLQPNLDANYQTVKADTYLWGAEAGG